MTENIQKFLEIASKEDGEFHKKLNDMGKDEIIQLAAEKGVTLTDADFEQNPEDAEGEVSLDEGDAVAGGKKCYCAMGGGGKAGDRDFTCWCVLAGSGEGKRRNGCLMLSEKGYEEGERCLCVAYGSGESYNQ